MTKRVALVALLLTAVAVGIGMLRLSTAWNQSLVLPTEGVLITVAKGENLGQVHRSVHQLLKLGLRTTQHLHGHPSF